MKNKKEFEKMMDEKKEEVKPLYHEGHHLKSRRDFLAQGFLGMSAFALAPTALSLMSRSANAAECAPPMEYSMTPVIIIDLAGGGNLAGSNVMVGGQGGQLDFLQSYNTLGLPSDMHPSMAGQLNTEMGLAFHADSGVLRGIRSVAAMSTRSKTEGAVFCTTSADDTENNQSNPIYWLNKAGAKGTLQQLAGTSQSESGGRSKAPAESLNPSVAPVRIASARDAENLVSLGNRFNEFSAPVNGDETRVDSILNAANNISNKKLDSIARRSLPEAIRDLFSCGLMQTNAQIKKFSPATISPTGDTPLKTIFDKVTNQTNRDRTIAITKLVLEGYIGVGTIVLGGYDYHNGTRALGETRDFELGQIIGAIMESAALKRKDVVIYVLTDGGVSAGNGVVDNSVNGRGKFVWTGDSGQRSSTFMMVYKDTGRPSLRSSNRQIGHFKPNGAVEGSAMLTSNSVVNTSKAFVANYLALHGEEGKLAEVVGDDPFRSNLDKYLVFNKLR